MNIAITSALRTPTTACSFDLSSVEIAREVEQGDVPTARLTADWRERAEDVVWTILNSPEFVFVP